MANLKNITDLPIAESADGLNLIVNDNGSAKQIAASAVGAQADWAVTDENSPAFIKNKPVEEWDLDLLIEHIWNAETSAFDDTFTANDEYSYDAFVAKLETGEIPNVKVKFRLLGSSGEDFFEFIKHPNVLKIVNDSNIYGISWWTMFGPIPASAILNSDGSFVFQLME